MSTVATPRRYTPEDLLHLPDGEHYELLDGRLVEHRMSTWATYVAGRMYQRLQSFCDANPLGWVFPEGASYQCFPEAPGKVRKADVSVIRLARLSADQATSGAHLRVAPDLAVEVVSPTDLVYEVDAKVQDYLQAGTQLVWVINPEARWVEVHRAHGPATILREQEDLDGEEVTAGFAW